ncbi:FadR family transcriptional regulator [Planosporangium thailandense]|uniref:FadR family transcriptional regulator n=1 Tax=Planosporangium thailandense TaxID=765197 RepID=A0ABX0Y4Y5_9ACTN|nr:FadR/GntR family transcriptional regulator [Planosporangium thailandense]NJC73470.1 FadR family transcriptional regulator [Planosporangium thailandense]
MPPAFPASPSTAELAAALGGSIEGVTAVTEVARRLLAYFTSGDIEPGIRLPAERQLAASLGVGRSAIREALAALEILGVVTVRPGSGTYLRGTVSELLPQTLSWGMLLGEQKTRELIGVRHGLEVQAARLAATSITEDGLSTLAGHLATMKTNTGTLDAFVAADMLFHQELAAAADNDLLSEMLQSVRSLIRVWVERAVDDPEHAQQTCREHEAILAALRARDPKGAAEAMSSHMESAGERLIAASGEPR